MSRSFPRTVLAVLSKPEDLHGGFGSNLHLLLGPAFLCLAHTNLITDQLDNENT